MIIQPRHIRSCTLVLAMLCIVLALACAGVQAYRTATYTKREAPTPQPIPTELPFAFKSSKEAYIAIGEPLLHLEQGFSLTKLPDIRNYFVFYGMSHRPDCTIKEARLLIGIHNLFPPQACGIGEKLYLRYNGPVAMHRWSFSEKNSETAIWLEPEYSDNHLTLHLKMKDAQGNIIAQPSEFADFIVPQMPLGNSPELIADWTIGSESVDTSYLSHLGAHWYGHDLFLETYGKDDYPFANDAIRIEFTSPEPYAIYAKESDMFVFEDDVWHMVEEGDETKNKDLLFVNSIDEAKISFTLWDAEGRHTLALDLPHTNDPGLSPQSPEIKLVGARSRTHWIVEILGKRTLVRNDDWFLFADGKCEKIASVSFLDDYLRGAIKGELIVLTGAEKQNNSYVLVGERYSMSRAQVAPITISMASQANSDEDNDRPQTRSSSRTAREQDNDEDYDDDDEDDDEDYDDREGGRETAPPQDEDDEDDDEKI